MLEKENSIHQVASGGHTASLGAQSLSLSLSLITASRLSSRHRHEENLK
jgi:hypothetical protein